MCCGAAVWSDSTARWQATGGRCIKRNAGHERVSIPAAVSVCRAGALDWETRSSRAEDR